MAKLIQRVHCRSMPRQIGCHLNRREERGPSANIKSSYSELKEQMARLEERPKRP